MWKNTAKCCITRQLSDKHLYKTRNEKYNTRLTYTCQQTSCARYLDSILVHLVWLQVPVFLCKRLIVVSFIYNFRSIPIYSLGIRNFQTTFKQKMCKISSLKLRLCLSFSRRLLFSIAWKLILLGCFWHFLSSWAVNTQLLFGVLNLCVHIKSSARWNENLCS